MPHPSLKSIAAPLLGEFFLGICVALGGLWLASLHSDEAAATLGLSVQVMETLFVLFRILALGIGVVIAQGLGSGQIGGVKKTARTVLGACTWVGGGVALLLFFGDSTILRVLNTPPEMVSSVAIFMAFLAPVALFEAYNLCMAAILRAHFFARESMWVMVAMHTTHIALAVPLMLGIGAWAGLGVNGFAVALLVSRLLGLGLHLWLWRYKMQLKPHRADWWHFSPRALWPILRIGLPGAALDIAYRSAFMVSLAAVAYLGVEALATHSYTLQILKFVLLISLSVGWACEVMVGRLVGAGQFRMADVLVKKGVHIGLIASGSLALLAALCAPWIFSWFTHDPAVIEMGTILLWISIVLELGRVFNLVILGALRATGDTIFPVAASSVSLFFILACGSYLVGPKWGLIGIWVVYAVDETLRGLVMYWRWHKRGWLAHAKHSVNRLKRA